MNNPSWTRDELILALDLYFGIDFPHNQSRKNPRIEELSKVLNGLLIHEAHFRGGNFRNRTSVYMKLSNFLRFDPEYAGQSLEAGSKLDEVVWKDFASDLTRLRCTAQLIKSNCRLLPQNQADESSADDEEFPEGKILTRLHKHRERSPTLTKKKKAKVLKDTGRLACQVCGFDFNEVYGDLGYDYAECHHTIPLSSLKSEGRTKLSDLAIVCANCHRMLHRSRTWISPEELRRRMMLKGGIRAT
jgi:5-methylcytosine-specific restriction protein A